MVGSKAARIIIVGFFILVSIIGSVIVALRSPSDCTDSVLPISNQDYVVSSCGQ